MMDQGDLRIDSELAIPETSEPFTANLLAALFSRKRPALFKKTSIVNQGRFCVFVHRVFLDKLYLSMLYLTYYL